MKTISLDLHVALRRLHRNPTYAAAAVLCLGLGIGAVTSMFGALDALFLSPPAHVHDVDRLVIVDASSFPAYRAVSAEKEVFANVAAYGRGEISVSVATAVGTYPLSARLVTASYPRTLGMRPVAGRFFTPQEDRPGAALTVVLGYDAWQRLFNGDPSVLGETVHVGASIATIVGVLPESFAGLDNTPVDLLLPIEAATALGQRGAAPLYNRDSFWLTVVGRLRTGVTVQRARAMIAPLVRRMAPAGSDPQVLASLGVTPVMEVRRGRVTPRDGVSLWSGTAAILVLIVACVDVANLLLARSVVDEHERAIRYSLGASRTQVLRPLIAEAVLLAIAGGALGVGLAALGCHLVRKLLASRMPWLSVTLDTHTVLFVSLATGVAMSLCIVQPAIQLLRRDAAPRPLNAAYSPGARASRIRRALLSGQVGIVVVLLAMTALFVQSVRGLLTTDLGIDSQHLVVATSSLGASRSLFTRDSLPAGHVRDAVSRVEGVRHVSVATAAPLSGGMTMSAVLVDGQDPGSGSRQLAARFTGIDSAYFHAVGVEVVEGRAFTARDVLSEALVAIVSQRFARMAWPGESALGKCIRLPPDPVTCRVIVGVVTDTRMPLGMDQGMPEWYSPVDLSANERLGQLSLVIRTSGDPQRFLPAIRRAIREAGNGATMEVQPATAFLDPILEPWRLGATLAGVCAAIAVVLTVVGVGGMLAYGVAQRRREIAIRLALGARPGRIARLVLIEGVLISSVGVVLGIGGALVMRRSLAHVVLDVGTLSPGTLALIAILVLGIALSATYLPARMAIAIDPIRAIKED